MLHNPRDARLSAIKIIHDYDLKCTLLPVVRIYFDIETACFGSNGVPEHTDKNAFITCIAAVVVEDGVQHKHLFLNN
jgi:hypothetical protein